MIEMGTLIEILVGVIVIGGAIVGFFTMQTRQNMRIKQLETEVAELKRKQSVSTTNQIKTEKAIIEINATLKHIAASIDELKKNGV